MAKATTGKVPRQTSACGRRLLTALALAVLVLPASGGEPKARAEAKAGAKAEAEAKPAPESLQVLHWWQSASERRAVDLLAERLGQQHVQWRDAMVPGGSGIGAGIVLRSRVLAKDAPEVAQLNGIVIRDWANLGLLADLDQVAARGDWERQLLPAIAALIRPGAHVVAAPLGIHRINILFHNRALFARHGLSAPVTWPDFERAAAVLARAGITPLAQSSEPWQVATLFETLVLAEGGAAYFRQLFQQREPAAFADPRLGRALMHLRGLKKWMGAPVRELSWAEEVRQVAEGSAGMLVMGDWAKGELNAMGLNSDRDIGCGAVPGTAAFHLYNVDMLSMLAERPAQRAAQETLAAMVMQPALQRDYSRVKGSVPVLRAPDLAAMDACARASWTLFATSPAGQVPSMVHRMATDETARDAMVAELHRFFLNERVSVADTQRRLGVIGRRPQDR
ncbi:ABC transporter substrate-binding protein [Massilia antarctica]|uniref:ABC transporter substrate-binding protein n=1 Tax=Massilia antarctica TaxID=2765360 RepID=UPI0006BD0D04|nr:ABC transporter substrate-binding protein [Massilia sp. H27-R4]CUI06690.1 ABC-type sugar transport system, periplasmic component [Janthinobacterium sp. CG23_2]CUU30476.1 ABC-type sugar transport system, periplasmic component [Janthinobacterium sp. CG23_2]